MASIEEVFYNQSNKNNRVGVLESVLSGVASGLIAIPKGFFKDNPTKDEVDFLISKGTALPDGRYVIGARLVEKKGNEVAFIV